MARLTFFAMLLALPFAPLHAQSAPAPITEASLRAHIAVLADDAMEGREAGTAGERLAAGYIAGQFAASGLRPVGGESYYQPVALLRRSGGSVAAGWSHDGERDAIDPEHIGLLGHDAVERISDAPMIFGGLGGDALADTDVGGAIVFIFSRMPPGGEGASYAECRRAIVARGAAGVIALHDPELSADYAVAAVREGRTTLAGAPMARIDGALSAIGSGQLLALAGMTPEEALAQASQPGFAPVTLDYVFDASVTTVIAPIAAYNVVARLEGSGVSDEAVLMMAHYDHTGICSPEGEADRICNGAVDNGSGVAVLIETARIVAAGPRPPRDILFVATTAEEIGLLGARALVETPVVPVETIVAALNLDTVAIVPSGMPVAILGRGRTGLDSVVDAVTREAVRTVDADNEADAFLQRQDGWALMEAGIPSIMVGGSFSDMARLMAYIEGPYHQPNDDLASIPDLGGALDDANLHIALVRALADPERYSTAPNNGVAAIESSSRAETVNAAAQGLVAQIEDDVNPDTPLRVIRAQGCIVTIAGAARSWTIDWAEIGGIGLGDPSFVFIAAQPTPLAIVIDGSQPAQLERVRVLAEAMGALHESCRPN